MNEQKKYYVALNMVTGIGPVLAKRLLDRFGSAKAVFEAGITRLVEVAGISLTMAEGIKTILSSDAFNEEMQNIKDEDVYILCFEDSAYPMLLKEIYDPPIVLYLKGNLSLLDKISVSVVGCRRASFNGLVLSERIARDLSMREICVVSGLARGIDTAAHKGALKGPGSTIAVLGSGLKYIYPLENKVLFDDISRHGIIMSEFPMNTSPQKGNFPRRNRIISGLSLGVVVIEAAQRSGSLITANLALSQNREVFAMPGAANSINAKGVNRLIKEGAKLVENVDDIIDELNVRPVGEKITSDCLKQAVNSNAKLSFQEEKLLEFLSSEPMHIDLLIKNSDLSNICVYKNLLDLQLKGLIKEIDGKRFIKKEG